jgi:hypothetical protein
MYYQAQQQAVCYTSSSSNNTTATPTTAQRLWGSGTTLLLTWFVWITALSITLWQWHRWRSRQVLWIQASAAAASAAPTSTETTATSSSTSAYHDDNNNNTTAAAASSFTTPPQQYGWRTTRYGRCLYHAVYVSRIGWIVLLLVVSWHYYAVNDEETVLHFLHEFIHYTSQEQTLRHFIVLWTFGLLWNLTLPSGTALALWTCSPCSLDQATCVTFAENDQNNMDNQNNDTDMKSSIHQHSSKNRFFQILHTVLEWTRKAPPAICPVIFLGTPPTSTSGGTGDNSSSGSGGNHVPPLASQSVSSSSVTAPAASSSSYTRCITHQLQRYVYNPVTQTFVPALWYSDTHDGIRLHVMLRQVSGLSSAQVHERWVRVGSNTMDMPYPQYWGCLQEELSQRFYTYQWFMITSWCPIDYYYMACTFVSVCCVCVCVPVCFV